MNFLKKLAKNPLLIAIIVTALLICIVGAVFAVKGENPIDSFMINVRDDGFTQPEESETTDENVYTDQSESFSRDDPTTDKSFTENSTTEKTTEKKTENTSSETSSTTEKPTSSSTSATTTATTSATTSTTATTATTGSQTVSADTSYFSDALFIGDSRTVGFYQYAPVEGAKYFARTSMSIYNIFNSSKSETGTGDASLETYLKNNKFGKIYILLGINEIGGSIDAIVSEYGEVLAKIKQLQPGAKIIIQSNMHVSAKKSASNPNSFNNKRIDELNSKLSKLADNRVVYYLDFTHVFDDENGNLRSDYTSDGVHFYAKCYKEWRNWIVENGKV